MLYSKYMKSKTLLMMVKDAGGERGRTTVWRRWRVFKRKRERGKGDYKPCDYCNQHDYIWLNPLNKNSTNKPAYMHTSEHCVPVSILIIWHWVSKGAFITTNTHTHTHTSLITEYCSVPLCLDGKYVYVSVIWHQCN